MSITRDQNVSNMLVGEGYPSFTGDTPLDEDGQTVSQGSTDGYIQSGQCIDGSQHSIPQ